MTGTAAEPFHLARLTAQSFSSDVSMHRISVALTAVSLAFGTRASAQTARDSAVAAVNEFFRAMTARDTAATRRIQLADGIHYATRQRGDSLVIRRGTSEAYLQQLGTERDVYVERIWDPTVLVHGPIAVVWAKYDIYRGKEFSHCGVDAFTLIRASTGWKIATITYTVEPTGCAPSPLGPVR